LFLLFDQFNYNFTATTRGWGTLPVNTTRSGTIAGAQTVALVPSFPAASDTDPTQFTYIELSVGAGVASLSPFDNTECRIPSADSPRTNAYFHFCPGSGWSMTPQTTFMQVQGDDQAAASQAYSVLSTSYPLGSHYRTRWNVANDVNVTFDSFTNRLRRRTVEWDNRNEGWTVTMRQNTDVTTLTFVNVFEDCTYRGTITCSLNGIGSTCVFGTSDSQLPGSFSGSKIRLLLSESSSNGAFDYSANFHYQAGGNCRVVNNPDQRFCGAYIDQTRRYNFVSTAAIDDRDVDANDFYDATVQLYNVSAATAACIDDLKAFACQTYFLPCDDDNFNVDKTPCGTACDAIVESCGANQCFDTVCDAIECPNSASRLLGILPLLSLFFFWLSL